jgi:hypothetical protein
MEAIMNQFNEMLRTVIAKEEEVKSANRIVRFSNEYNYNPNRSKDKLISKQEEVMAKSKELIDKQQSIIDKQQKRIELQEKMIAALQEKLAKYESSQEPEPEVPDFTVEDIAGGFQLERGCKAIGIDNPIVDMYPLHLSEVTDEDIVIIEELRELMCLLDSMNEYGDQVCEAIIELNTLLSRVYEWRKQNEK